MARAWTGVWNKVKGTGVTVFNKIFRGGGADRHLPTSGEVGIECFPNEYKILMIGETGSGKTSFLNFICNAEIIQKVSIDAASASLRSFHDIELENAQASPMESKTSGAKLYETKICGLDVGVIDSPGFGDSRGLKQDKANSKAIVSALRAEDYINCICLIINGRTSRISATLKYVMSEITAILPRAVLNNIVVVFTNSADFLDVNFDVQLLYEYFGQEVPQHHIFCIENPYCRFEKAKQKRDSLPPEKIFESLKDAFIKAGEMLKMFYMAISKFNAIHTHYFVELYDKKQEIERHTMHLLTEYDNQQRREAKIKNAKEAVQAAANSQRLNKDFKTTQTIERWIQVKTDEHNTLCGAPNCYSNCHAPCHLDKSFDKECFKHCASIKPHDHCKKCGHSYKFHYHNEIKFKKVTEKIEIIDKETQQRFQRAKDMEEAKCIFLAGLQQEELRAKEQRRLYLRQLYEKIVEFHKLGITRNYAKLLENQIAMIEHRLEGQGGEDTATDLREVKEKLETQLKVVLEAVNSHHSTLHSAVPYEDILD